MTTQHTSKKTDYMSGLFNGQQYANSEQAIIAGAKAYAKKDWKALVRTLNVLDIQVEEKTLAEALIEAKRQIIVESIEATAEDIPYFE